jgi:hypothetical protein
MRSLVRDEEGLRRRDDEIRREVIDRRGEVQVLSIHHGHEAR